VRRFAWALVVAALALTGCGGDGDDLRVSAASSLRPLSEYGAGFGDASVKTGFGGSDDLAAQIRQGVDVDVYAAANTELPAALHREALVEKPVVFAANRLVIAVPSDSGVDSIEDLTRPGTKVAMGSRSVPAGRYAREVVARLGGRGRAILANVRAEEPDVKGVVGKIAQGAVDAGFVYVTDVAAADGRIRAVTLPRDLQPTVNYSAAVVRGSGNADAARAYLRGLTGGKGARILRDAGFEPPR
jgi:molybdate transport system substrate-binding protein